jgi:hypothetical protein
MAGRKRRGLLSPRHAGKLLLRSYRAARRRHRVVAVALLLLGLVELAAWLTLTGAALILATAAVLAGATAIVAALLSGTGPDPRRRWGRP